MSSPYSLAHRPIQRTYPRSLFKRPFRRSNTLKNDGFRYFKPYPLLTIGTIYYFRKKLTRLFEEIAEDFPPHTEQPSLLPAPPSFKGIFISLAGLSFLGIIGLLGLHGLKINKTMGKNKGLNHNNGSTAYSPKADSKKMQELIKDYAINARIPTHVLFNNPSQLEFKQYASQTCYFLSIIGGILRHPEASKILDDFIMIRTADGISVRFPNPDIAPVHLKPNEVGHGVQSDTVSIQILEAAYLKIPGSSLISQQDDALDAFNRIFGKKGEMVALDKQSPTIANSGLAWRGTIENHQSRNYSNVSVLSPILNHYLQEVKAKPNEQTILMAIRNAGGHYYSVLPHQSKPNHIVLADPFRINQPQEMTIKEFLENGYQIRGRILNPHP